MQILSKALSGSLHPVGGTLHLYSQVGVLLYPDADHEPSTVIIFPRDHGQGIVRGILNGRTISIDRPAYSKIIELLHEGSCKDVVSQTDTAPYGDPKFD